MEARWVVRALLGSLAAAMLVCAPVAARGAAEEGDGGEGADGADALERRPWWVPDQAKLQFAGNIGFLSPGIGWATDGGALETDLFFGWIPESVGGDRIVSLTGKLTWFPWRLERGGGWQVQPLSLALQLTNTFGEEYFVWLPDHYPDGYYTFSTALRAGVAIGAAAGRPLWGLRLVGGYVELVALDAMLVAWAMNPDSLGPRDVFSVALGLKIGW